MNFLSELKFGKLKPTKEEKVEFFWWQEEFQYLLDGKILSRDEIAYLFGQIKSIIEREKNVLIESKRTVTKETLTEWTRRILAVGKDDPVITGGILILMLAELGMEVGEMSNCGCEGSCPICRIREVDNHKCNKCFVIFCPFCHGIRVWGTLKNNNVADCKCREVK
jgi:hypothetical protein